MPLRIAWDRFNYPSDRDAVGTRQVRRGVYPAWIAREIEREP